MSLKKASQLLELNYSTAKSIRQVFKRKGLVNPKLSVKEKKKRSGFMREVKDDSFGSTQTSQNFDNKKSAFIINPQNSELLATHGEKTKFFEKPVRQEMEKKENLQIFDFSSYGPSIMQVYHFNQQIQGLQISNPNLTRLHFITLPNP